MMEETKTEVKEVVEKKQTANKVKSFKMNENDLARVNELLSGIEGSTDAEKLIEALELTKKTYQVAELPNQLERAFEGDRHKLVTAITMINSIFNTMMANTAEVMDMREKELQEAAQDTIDELITEKEKLLEEIEELKIQRSSAISAKEEIKQHCEEITIRDAKLVKDLDLRDKTIDTLTAQLEEAKAEMQQARAEAKNEVEEMKAKVAQKDAEIIELVADSRKYKEKIETLETKNEELMTKSVQNQQENQVLTGQLSILEVSLKNEQDKNADLKNQIEKLQSDLDVQHQSKDDLQANLIQLMSQMSQSNPVTVQKEIANAQLKTQKKVKKPFVVIDQAGKELWSGNKNGLVRYVNSVQDKKEVTTSTAVNEIEDLLHPCTLITNE